MVAVNDLSFAYPNTGKNIHFSDFSLNDLDSLLILGPSGVGKTTLMHLMAGLLTPQSGSIILNTTNLSSLDKKSLNKFRGQHIGLVFQTSHAIGTLNVIENLKIRLFFSKKKVDPKRIDQLLDRLGIAELKHQYPYQLSQGQSQRLGIALSLVHQPKLILADEPTSSLDDVNAQKAIDLLKEEAKTIGANLITITHDQRITKQFDHQLCLS